MLLGRYIGYPPVAKRGKVGAWFRLSCQLDSESMLMRNSLQH